MIVVSASIVSVPFDSLSCLCEASAVARLSYSTNPQLTSFPQKFGKFPPKLRGGGRPFSIFCVIGHNFVQEFSMIFSTQFSETSLKRGRLGGVHKGGMTAVEEAINILWILLIFYERRKPICLLKISQIDEEGESSLDPCRGHDKVYAIASLGHGCYHDDAVVFSLVSIYDCIAPTNLSAQSNSA